MARYWLFMAIMAIKKKEKCVSKLWKKGCDPPPLIFAEMSIGLKHKKSVSNLWIGRDPPPPPLFSRVMDTVKHFFKIGYTGPIISIYGAILAIYGAILAI